MSHTPCHADSCNAEAPGTHQDRHDNKTQDPACKAVQDAEHTAEDESGKQDPRHGKNQRFFPVCLVQHDHNDQICKAELNPRCAEPDRDQSLHIAENQCKCGEYAEISCSVFQIILSVYCAIPSNELSLELTTETTTLLGRQIMLSPPELTGLWSTQI